VEGRESSRLLLARFTCPATTIQELKQLLDGFVRGMVGSTFNNMVLTYSNLDQGWPILVVKIQASDY
jgi:hypothetical protein